ncbi:MAG: glycosyltransferase [Bacteroidales bacterium]|nr:glycosyltransferase [Bacteroidales bacterium]
MKPVKLSVIICTYNRDKYIYNVLKSIAENDFPKNRYEIVLVNNNCTDQTEKECSRFVQNFSDVDLKIFKESNQGLSYARNRGVSEAGGDVLVYVDDDAVVNSEYLKTYADFFETHPEVDAAGGRIDPRYETREPDWFSKYIRQLITAKLDLGKHERRFPKGKFPGGGNAAYRKTVFDRVGLFNVELGRKGTGLIGAEEKDLFDKMTDQGIQFFYLPNAVLYHIIPDSKLTRDYFERWTYAIGKSEYLRTHSSRKKYLKRIFREIVKWGGTAVLWLRFLVCLQPKKGNKLIRFRYNVTRGLLGR